MSLFLRQQIKLQEEEKEMRTAKELEGCEAQKKLCFHSPLNALSLYGDTLIHILVSDIISVAQEQNCVILRTQDAEYRFTQFMFRDSAFETLQLLFKHASQQQQPLRRLQLPSEYSNGNKSARFRQSNRLDKDDSGLELIEGVQQGARSRHGRHLPSKNKSKDAKNASIAQFGVPLFAANEEQRAKLQERKAKLSANLPTIDKFKYVASMEFADITLRELFYVLFSDRSHGSHQTFCQYYLEQIGEKNVQVEAWNPSPPKFFTEMCSADINSLFNYSALSRRHVSSIHEQDTKIPMIGKVRAEVDMLLSAHFLDDRELVIEYDSKLKGVPYSDYFVLNAAYFLRERGGDGQTPRVVEVHQALNVQWLKSTILKGRLEKKFQQSNENLFLKKMKPIFVRAHTEWLEERKKLQQIPLPDSLDIGADDRNDDSALHEDSDAEQQQQAINELEQLKSLQKIQRVQEIDLTASTRCSTSPSASENMVADTNIQKLTEEVATLNHKFNAMQNELRSANKNMIYLMAILLLLCVQLLLKI